MIAIALGLDPGPTTGMCWLYYVRKPDGTYPQKPTTVTMLSTPARSATRVLEAMIRTDLAEFQGLAGNSRAGYDPEKDRPVLRASVEKFITGRSAGTKGANADVTRQLVFELTECCQIAGFLVKLRSAADVKPWASDKRLLASGIALPGDGVHGKARDGYDASRHALYGAVWDAKMTDPLITRKAA